jgi:sucrose synthase
MDQPTPADTSIESGIEGSLNDWASSLAARARPVELLDAKHLPIAKQFLVELREGEDVIVLRDRIQRALDAFLEAAADAPREAKTALKKVFGGCQEVFYTATHVYALLRPRVGAKRIVRLSLSTTKFEEVSRFYFLQVKDAYIQGWEEAGRAGLVLDFRPFFHEYPKVRQASAMGSGISVLNRHLAGTMHQNPDRFRNALADFLRRFRLNHISLLTNDQISSGAVLEERIGTVDEWLSDEDSQRPYAELTTQMRAHGFEPGWGATAGAVRENLSTLSEVLDSADPERLERLLGRLPLTRTVLMVSPHGWFAQNNVLGKPDTGGQVTYVLDQARALEREMSERFQACGIDVKPHIAILTRLIPESEDTTCHEPRELVEGSENCWIVRVPFRHADGNIHPQWVSRFHIWPYLEQFTLEAKDAVLVEFMCIPDLIVGHYSDGNLVAHRLADELGTTHCAAVHALEKTKYLMSDMHWGDMENEYHFSCQFTADMIAYNAADFIISSSYREIGGTDTEMGMFESYETFSMPGLFRVTSGMDPSLARYNIVPPGASEEHFYPYSEKSRRSKPVKNKLVSLLFAKTPPENCVGRLDNPNLPPVFAMSRVDRVKNLPGLIEAYGKSETLRKTANLIVMSSITRVDESKDQEEIEQLQRMYELIGHYQLDGSLRWCAARLDKVATGEIYRLIADRKGVFAQPAFMETFGLTVIEAMACGLPVVVTCFGGPAEIVEHRRSGEVVNPNDMEAMADALQRVVTQSDLWQTYSREGIERVHRAFHWRAHAERVLRLANTYSFWAYLDVMNRQALDQYIHTLYHTVYRPRAVAALG